MSDVATRRFEQTDIERVKEYWDARPCNIRHSPLEIGTKGYFDQVEARKYFVEPHIPLFADFPSWRDKRVLEIGCGIGTDTMNFARAGAHVTAIDVSEKSLEIARQRADVFGLSDRITFAVADAERLSDVIEPRPFDLVYSFGVIHHSPQPQRIVAQIRDHFVAADSTVKVMVYHRYSAKVLSLLVREAKGAFWKLDEVVAANSEAQTGCPVTYTYSKRSGAELLDGFEVDDSFVTHVFPYRVPEYVKYEYVKKTYARLMPRPVWNAFERRFGWHLCITARPR